MSSVGEGYRGLDPSKQRLGSQSLVATLKHVGDAVVAVMNHHRCPID